MRKLALLLLLAAFPLAAETFTGLIAFAECAEDKKITEADHAKCAKGKDRDFQLIVFYNEKDKKNYDLIDEGEVEEFIGKRVVIEGRVEEGFLVIDSIKSAGS